MNGAGPRAAIEQTRVEDPPRKRLAVKDLILQYGMIVVLVALVVLATIIYPRFLDPINIRNILSQSAPVGIVAAGMTLVMIAGGFDLSVGAIFALAAVLFAMLADGLGLWGAGAVALATGLACGAVNGFLVTRANVNTFVATLGTGSVFGGIAYIVSRSAPHSPENYDFQELGVGSLFGVPYTIILLVLCLCAGGLILARTVYGRALYAIGGNMEAARLSGIKVESWKAATYAISGACAALAGMLLASRLGVGQADMGSAIALDAIAIVVVGGTSLLGGEGAMWRTAVGLLILATLTNVFDALAVSTNYQLVTKGLIVIGAVALDAYARSRLN
jgi:ribose transport system permease protein